ncbi:MAG: OstA-like protein [Syntrophomonadaceae bacterium]
MKTVITAFLLIFNSLLLFGQGRELITVTGDSLAGRLVNGESIREVIGHVVLKQGNIVITCRKATQYLAKNNAILEGSVVVRQDTLTIEAERGYYYGNDRIAECKTGVKLNDGKVILTAVNGDYYFNEQRAYFADSVKLYDTVSTMTCNTLNYYKNENRAAASGSVTINDSANTIKADSMTHLRATRTTFADGRVQVSNSRNNVVVYGNHLEDYALKKYTLINEKPLLMQVDTTADGKKDTLIISSRIMESYNDTSRTFVATDSVRILRGGFASANNYSIYYGNEEKIITYKRSKDNAVPVLWYENTQLSGDSVNIFTGSNRLRKIEVYNNCFILSHNEGYNTRYDQISGDQMTILFDSTGINHTDVFGNVLSIYFMYDKNEPNGLTKSSAQKAKIFFRNKAVNEVKLYTSPVSEYYPENLVEKNELSFTLPAFFVKTGRPEKKMLLEAL